jgi:hypothetical protein
MGMRGKKTRRREKGVSKEVSKGKKNGFVILGGKFYRERKEKNDRKEKN